MDAGARIDLVSEIVQVTGALADGDLVDHPLRGSVVSYPRRVPYAKLVVGLFVHTPYRVARQPEKVYVQAGTQRTCCIGADATLATFTGLSVFRQPLAKP